MYEKISKITVKKKIIRIHNKIIEQRQIIQKKTRKNSTLEYKKEN